MSHVLRIIGILIFLTAVGTLSVGQTSNNAVQQSQIPELSGTPDFFPVVAQFSPVPSGKGWTGQEGPLSEEVLRDTIDNITEHGFTGIELGTHRPPEEEQFILNYAQSQGMIITAHTGALEFFGRNEPPKICVYSEAYQKQVRDHAEKLLAGLKKIPRLYNVFTYQDEPFHWGPKSFGYNEEVKREFKKRYGYDLPADLDSIKADPKKWLEVINFRSDYFPDGWRQVYKIIKEIDPSFKVVMTHDSHNTFGAGYGSHSEIAIDDVFHWGGDYADMFVFDIYPYMMFDFRFGEMAKLPLPRISQTHYSMAQMRNLTRAYKKELGFWVGTYNPAWFKNFICPQLKEQYWAEREMSTTAVAAGADYLLTGYHIPVDAKHWDTMGQGLQLIQKAGGKLLQTPKVKAKACMLFPRTQYIQMQEEYFNVGISFELFLRAFGELDILHEEQITDDTLDGYEILVLFDVKLLPKKVAEHIASFVNKGGIVIADSVPNLDEFKKPMPLLEELFGITEGKTDRIKRTGHWVPHKNIHEPAWHYRPADAPDESIFTSDTLKGQVLGQMLDLKLVSPRPCRVTTGQTLIKTGTDQPGLVRHPSGQGQTFLLGFCLQDTYFTTFQEENATGRDQLRGLLHAITRATKVQPHVYSSNPQVEASLRANDQEGYLFVINHEAQMDDTVVQLADLDFQIGKITDLADNHDMPFTRKNGIVELKTNAATGQTRLLRLDKQESKIVNLPKNTKVVMENTKPLQFSRGNRLGLYVWSIMGELNGLDDASTEQVLKQLDERGIAMCTNWSYGDKDKSLQEGLRIGALQQKLGLRVNVNANSCMHAFFNGDEKTFHIDESGKPFYDDSFGNTKMGCPFAVKHRYPAIKEQIEYFLRGYKEKGEHIDFVFADWEIDGPIEWNDAWANSKKCKRCRENIKDIDNFSQFQKQLRQIRSDMQRVVFAENVLSYFPEALVGNYGVYPHNGYRYWYDYFEKPVPGAPYQSDQKARYRQWSHEFDQTAYTFAMPTVYPWVEIFDWYDFKNPDYCWFYNMLLVATNAARHTPKDVPIISFVHWNTIGSAGDHVKQFSEENYKELLWHMLLRGVDGLFLWCMEKELPTEIQPLHQVYASALQYRDYLDKGQAISFEVPKQQGPVVSGLRLGNKLLLRRTDFDDTSETIELQVGNQKLQIPRVQGKCQELVLTKAP
ncbi:MAG: hypothetical protein JXD22_11410 [Sedimentisphaerales bacterium]|nr:hypothetical protein [Sedimentisphaerales bacterium]